MNYWGKVTSTINNIASTNLNNNEAPNEQVKKR